MAIELLAKETVVLAVAMGGIADNGVRQMLEVTAQLMATAAQRLSLYQAITAGGITPYREGEFSGGQAAKIGAGRPGLNGRGLGGTLIRFIPERIVDGTLLGAMTAHYRKVLFIHLTVGKSFSRSMSRFG
jgi:hypothetical protein